jgi:hypothetical protein
MRTVREIYLDDAEEIQEDESRSLGLRLPSSTLRLYHTGRLAGLWHI